MNIQKLSLAAPSGSTRLVNEPVDSHYVAAVMASAPSVRAHVDPKIPLIPGGVPPAVVDHYRRLRTKISQQQTRAPFRSLMVTSAVPGEGKTVTALNLAFSAAMVPTEKVLVVDADLRIGKVGKYLGIDGRPGLGNLLAGAPLDEVIVTYGDTGLYCMPAGSVNESPTELLTSQRLASSLKSLATEFSLIVIDAPPVNVVADAGLVAAASDAILLVARAYQTKRKALQQALQELRPYRLLGTVLNGGEVASYPAYSK